MLFLLLTVNPVRTWYTRPRC